MCATSSPRLMPYGRASRQAGSRNEEASGRSYRQRRPWPAAVPAERLALGSSGRRDRTRRGEAIRLVPRLLSGRIDPGSFGHPPVLLDISKFLTSFIQTPILAIPSAHRLAKRDELSIDDIFNEPLIVPDRRSRPHSHDVTVKLFEQAGRAPRIPQSRQKQTIVHVVSSGLGMAIVPRWISGMALAGVTYCLAEVAGARRAPPTSSSAQRI